MTTKIPNWKRQRDTSERLLPGSSPSPRVDLGLAILETHARHGVKLTRHDIAAWCGCTDANIYRIERQAIAKITRALAFGRFAEEVGMRFAG